MNAEQENADFQSWLRQMDVAIARLRERLPADVRDQMDFSPASLDVLERWILNNYPTVDALRADKSVWDELGRYIGESFRRRLGGYWEIRLDDPRYVYHGVPQITGFSRKPTPICPHVLSTVVIDRRRGNFLSRLLNSAAEQEGKHK